MIIKRHFGETDGEEYVKTPLEKVVDPIGLAGFERRFEPSLSQENIIPGATVAAVIPKLFNQDPFKMS